jgi:hypothetical protein
MFKLNLIIGIAISATISILFTNIAVESFSQAASNNATRDAMGNYVNFTNSTVTDLNNNNLMKEYPTNTSK